MAAPRQWRAFAIQGTVLVQGFFRREVLDAQATRSLGTVRLATPVSHQGWALASMGLAACLLAWLFAGHYVRREHVTGSLVPEAGLVSVTARSAGTVVAVDVTEGATVHAGDVLLTLSGERSSASMGDTSADISAQLRDQQSRLRSDLVNAQKLADEQERDLRMQQTMLKQQIQQLDAQADIEQRQANDLSALLRRLQGLGAKGYVSALDIQQQRTQESDAEQQIKSLARQRYESEQQLLGVGDQLTQLPLTTAAKLDDLHRQVAQNEQALAQNEADRATVLRAPESGMVSAVLIKQGQAVTPGEALLAVMPRGSLLQAQLLVPSSAIGFVHMGTDVALHYQSFPYQKFGVQHGTVSGISHSALTSSEVALLLGQQAPAEALYRVQVRLAAQSVMAYGKPESLRPGMVMDADLLLDKRRMIEWIFEPLYGMARRYGREG